VPHWTTYGLLGLLAGPLVMTFARSVTHDEQVSLSAMTRCGWMPLASASGFLCTALCWIATQAREFYFSTTSISAHQSNSSTG